MLNTLITRRALNQTGAGLAAGIFATPVFRAAARQDATPEAAPLSQGFVSMRVRTVESAEARAEVNNFVLEQFIPDVQQLKGYGGYLVGDVIENDTQSLSVVLLEEESHTQGFDALAQDFVAGLSDTAAVNTVDTTEWSGDLLMHGYPIAGNVTPDAEPAESVLREGYAAVRVHTSLPDTDPRDFVPLATEDFVPRMEALEGFEGYLWFPTEGGFVAISLFDSEESAEASNREAVDWAADFLADYTDGNPEIINANIVWAEFPLLATL